MAELLKNKYNKKFIDEITTKIKIVYPQFASKQFISEIFTKGWDELSLKNRIRQIAINLKKYLPINYKEAILVIDKVLDSYPNQFNDITLLIFPDFVQIYGQSDEHWNLSVKALEKYTKYSTSEFAVQQFIIKNPIKMMKQLETWTKHQNNHVRRLASEGCRPQLPWGQSLTFFKKDPSLILNILDKLKNDQSLYVRKSVANNLNDISKTHPQLIIKIAKRWYGDNKNTNWIIKHGCRTLLKQGNKEVLNIFGFSNTNLININHFYISNLSLYIGESIFFSFQIETKITSKIRLEYAIDFIKANNKQRRKIFQISEKNYNSNAKKQFIKKHLFVNRSTRKHYPGVHILTLIVNGVEWYCWNINLLSNDKF